MSTPSFWGTEHQVNLNQNVSQMLPQVAGLAGGRYAVTWLNEDTGVAALRIFHADGTPASGEYSLGAADEQYGSGPSIAALADGRMIVVWQTAGDNPNIVARYITSDGVVDGQAFTVSTSNTRSQHAPKVAASADGGFAITWHTDDLVAGDYDIRARFYDKNGVAAGSNITVDISDAEEHLPRIAALSNGNYVVVWMDGGDGASGETDGSFSHIRAEIFSPTGVSIGGEFVVNSTAEGAQFDPAVVALADGGFIVSWTDGDEVGGNGYENPEIVIRSFTNAGAPISNDFAISAYDSVSGDRTHSTMTALKDGSFLLAWQQSGNARGMILDATSNGGFIGGGAFTMNQFAGTQSMPALTTLADGRIVATWQESGGVGPDVSGLSVRATILEPREGGDGGVGMVLVGKTNLKNELIGNSFNDSITGGAQSDTLWGMDGDDVIHGGAGADLLLGGDGADHFRYRIGDGADVISDFAEGAGPGDKVVLADRAGLSSLADVLAKATQVAADTVINFGSGDTLTLQNVSKASLAADDFILDFFTSPAVALNSFGSSAAGGGWINSDIYPRTAADVDGDGRADIVGFGDAGAFVAFANEDGTLQSPVLALSSFGFSAVGGSWTSNNQYPRTLGDVNGDGRADVVGFGDTGVFVALANDNGAFQSPSLALNSFGFSAGAGGWSSNDKYPRTVADVNGDGRADLVGFGDAGVFVALGNANGTFQNPIVGINSFGFSPAGGGWTTNDKYPRALGDVNGDGRADIVGFGDAGVFVALGNADGTFQSPIAAINSFGYSPAGGGWTSNNQYPRTLGDVSGDGRADIVGFGDAGLYVALGKADGTFASPIADLASFGLNAGGWSSNSQYPRTLADVNADGADDVVGFGNTGVFVSLSQDFMI